jgi:hypothetical protein
MFAHLVPSLLPLLPQLPTAVLSTTARAKSRAAKKAKDSAADGGDKAAADGLRGSGGADAMETDAAEGAAAEGGAAAGPGETREEGKAAEPEASSFTGEGAVQNGTRS